jgi:NADH:ubiquinone oxidoreductase subunit B-like Fe-S oxidoreductase
MSDRLDTSLQKLKRETVLKVSPSRKRRLKRHMRSKKVTTTRKDQLQHESNLKHINSTFHQLVQFTSLNSVLNHIISYMLSPSIGTVMHLSHCLNDCDPYGILSRESKQASEPMIWILKTLEYYVGFR